MFTELAMIRTFGAIAALLISAAAVGCYDMRHDCNYFECGAGGSGGTGAGGTGGTDPGCVPGGRTDAVGDECGVFVSASGNDTNGDGTKAKPFATLAKALTAGTTLYACVDAKPFDEALTVEGTVTLFGGLDCTSWIHVADTKTSWTAPGGEVVAMVRVDATLHAEDFIIEAQDAPPLMADEHAPGRSSIAIVAETKSRLELARCNVNAGMGSDGAPGEAPVDTGTVGAVGENGGGDCTADDAITAPGNGGAGMCAATDVSGGLGGIGTKNMSGGDGSAGNPAGDLGKGGLGQKAGACEAGGDGMLGTTGPAGNGATKDGLGSLTANGFLGVRGSDGTPGTPGQGGGGGGGAKVCANVKAGPSGAGGGAGGCAGTGGKGGYGGGASIGIATVGAKLSFAEVKITTKTGGKGGAGANGQPGGTGGLGGTPGTGDVIAKACAGGKGGSGGSGGKGGGGLGGHSIGIAHSGAAPETTGATITTGTAGAGGLGEGDSGSGAAGVAAKVQRF